MPVPNQKTVTIAERIKRDKEHLYSTSNLDALQYAMNNLKGESFKLWSYLNKNQDNYTLELSQKACELWGIKKDAYYTGVKTLVEKGFLVEVEKDKFLFYEKPVFGFSE